MHLERQLRAAEGPCVPAKQSEIDPEGNGGGLLDRFLNHMMIYKDLYFRKFLLAAIHLEEEV